MAEIRYIRKGAAIYGPAVSVPCGHTLSVEKSEVFGGPTTKAAATYKIFPIYENLLCMTCVVLSAGKNVQEIFIKNLVLS